MQRWLILLCLLCSVSWANEPAKVGVQLWSVHSQLKEDFKGTLEQLSNMGFAGVEFAGEFGPYANNPQALREFLSSLNLTTSGAHVSWEAISAKNIKQTAKFYHTLGAQYLIIGWDPRGWDQDRVDELLSELNEAQQRVSAAGFAFGYHNHDGEFNAYKERTFWDHIAQNTNQQFVLQLDVGWAVFAGKNPSDYIHRYPMRTLATHFKVKASPSNNIAPFIGEDNTDWHALIETIYSKGGTQWIIVEQEDYPEGVSPLEAIARSKRGLDALMATPN